MTPTLHIQTFGGLVLRLDERIMGVEIPVKAKAMLAYIARQNSAQPREKLSHLFWTDFPAERVVKNLRLALPPLREHLSENVEITRTEIGVRARLDVAAFEQGLDQLRPFIAGEQPFTAPDIKRFEEALALYRGDFLAHVDLPDASAFDEWASMEREALRQRFIVAGSRLLEAFTTLRRYSDGIELALRLLNADPLHEETYRQLMTLYAVSGDRTSGLQTFERLQSALWDELGVEPDDETIALYEKIAANEVEVLPDGPLTVNSPLPPTNLPGEMSPFLGRESELAEISALLETARCVTLVGTGGIGKTRLALKIAGRLRHAFPDGVFWVELAPLLTPAVVADTLRSTLGIEGDSTSTITDVLSDFLRDKHLLLVLDNFEHVLDASELVMVLMRAAPALHVLVTSREPLRLYGEYAYEVPALTRAESAALFIDRAKAIQPRFQVDDPALVDALCAQLEDIPLALELAASRARTQSLANILSRLNTASLTSPLRGVPERQRTLFNTVEWSYQLLTADEQRLYRRVAYFVGTWTEDAAAAVCAEAHRLEALVDKSLLRRREGDEGEARYSMLETIRQHARIKLNDAGEASDTLSAYLDYYVSFAEMANLGLRGRDEMLWTKRLHSNLDNLHAAIEYAAESAAVFAEARLVAALGRFWYFAGLHREAQVFGERALKHRDGLPPEMRAGVLAALGHSAFVYGNRQQAEAYHSEALSLYEAVGDLHGQAYMNMCLNAHSLSVSERLHFAQRAYEMFRESDEILLFGGACNNLANSYEEQGAFAEAEQIAREGLARVQGTSPLGETILLNMLTYILRDQGRIDEALTLLERYFRIEQRDAYFDLDTLILQGWLFLYIERLGEAETCLEATGGFIDEMGHILECRRQCLAAAIADIRGDQALMRQQYAAAYADVIPERFRLSDLVTISGGLAHLVWFFAREGWKDEALLLKHGLEQLARRHNFGLNYHHFFFFDQAAPLLAKTTPPQPAHIPDNPFTYALECLARL